MKIVWIVAGILIGILLLLFLLACIGKMCIRDRLCIIGIQSKHSFFKLKHACSFVIVNISCTINSSIFITSNERARYFLWSLYDPTSNNIPSNWPLIIVIGVFSSWEAAEKKFFCVCSSSFSYAISFWSCWLTFCKSVNVMYKMCIRDRRWDVLS